MLANGVIMLVIIKKQAEIALKVDSIAQRPISALSVCRCHSWALLTYHNCRLAKKVLEVMDALPQKQVLLLSTVPLALLEQNFIRHVMLRMSWTDELHQSCLYAGRHWNEWFRISFFTPEAPYGGHRNRELLKGNNDIYGVPQLLAKINVQLKEEDIETFSSHTWLIQDESWPTNYSLDLRIRPSPLDL